VDKTYQPKYYPTSDSNVPGPIQPLYWDPKLQTWYPKQRLTMNNSTNKWPTNYKLFRSAIQPSAPVLSVVLSTINSIELAWTINDKNNICYPISNFQIYVNNSIYKTIENSTNYTTTLTNLTKGPYEIYIVGTLSGNQSPPSNIVVYNNEIYKNPLLSSAELAAAAAVAAASAATTSVGGAIFNIFKNIYTIRDANINNNSNAIILPDRLLFENQQSITILNNTTDILKILSAALIYNIQFAPQGTNELEVAVNSIVIFTYVYDSNKTLTINASIS
jgi:hypothetical protein